MLLRIERHFKAEQAARRSADSQLAATEGHLAEVTHAWQTEKARTATLEEAGRSVAPLAQVCHVTGIILIKLIIQIILHRTE
jgi:hypothetical protein